LSVAQAERLAQGGDGIAGPALGKRGVSDQGQRVTAVQHVVLAGHQQEHLPADLAGVRVVAVVVGEPAGAP
jgi:hypothetical protein